MGKLTDSCHASNSLTSYSKSQIAMKYAYHRREISPDLSIFWLCGTNKYRFEKSYTSIAEEFQLSGRNDPNVDVLQLVRDWLEVQYQKPWLMIIDDVDGTHIFDKIENGKLALDYLYVLPFPKLSGFVSAYPFRSKLNRERFSIHSLRKY